MWPLWGESRKAEREVESSAITFIFTPGRGKSIGNVSEVKDVGATSSRNLTLAPPQIEQYVARKGHASGKEELGRATWTFLHTLAAQYPVHPTRSQERDVKNMIDILTRMYPCKECADHFRLIVRQNPPRAKSAEELQQWMCSVHNLVNQRLGKPMFNCRLVQGRWQALDCGEDADACALPGGR